MFLKVKLSLIWRKDKWEKCLGEKKMKQNGKPNIYLTHDEARNRCKYVYTLHFWEDFYIFKYLNYHIFIIHKGGLYILINVHLYFEHTQYTFDVNPYFQVQRPVFLSSDMLFHSLYFQATLSILALLLTYEKQ